MRKALCYEIRQFSGVSSEDEPPVTRRLPAFDASLPVQRTTRNGTPGPKPERFSRFGERGNSCNLQVMPRSCSWETQQSDHSLIRCSPNKWTRHRSGTSFSDKTLLNRDLPQSAHPAMNKGFKQITLHSVD